MTLKNSTPYERVEAYLDDLYRLDGERYTLVQRVRRLVLAAHPKVAEEVKYGGLLYSAGAPFCAIFSYPQHVALEFSRGAALPDKHHVLEGEGAKRRHIKLEGGQDVFKKNIREYIALAAAAAAATKPKRDKPTP
jgi:hypothetical protein